jgi:ribosomal protein S18 acetylase RimI-like enzyme
VPRLAHHRAPSPPAAEPALIADPWLADILGYPVFRAGGDLSGLREGCERLAGPAFLYAKVPTGEGSAIACVESAGFRLVDTNVRVEAAAPVSAAAVSTADVGPARPDEAGAVMALAERCFSFSRFHLDPDFPPEAPDRIKREWAGGFFRGVRGDLMIVAREGNRPVGFLLGLVSRGTLTVDLYAVSPEHRRRGIARAMVGAAARIAGPSRIAMGTQVTNLPSLNLFLAMGFRVTASQYVFHRHLRAAARPGRARARRGPSR